MFTHTLIPLLLLSVVPPVLGQDSLVIKAPQWGDKPWAPALVWQVVPLGGVVSTQARQEVAPPKGRRGTQVAEAVVEVVGRMEDPGRMTQRLIESHYRPLFQRAATIGFGGRDSALILSQFMSVESSIKGVWFPEPGAVHYNALVPDAIRMETFLGVGGGAWRAQVGVTAGGQHSRTWKW